MNFQLNEALYLLRKKKFQLTPKFYQWKYLSHGEWRAMTCLIRKINFTLGSSRLPKSICIIKNYQLFGFDLKAFWLLWEFCYMDWNLLSSVGSAFVNFQHEKFSNDWTFPLKWRLSCLSKEKSEMRVSLFYCEKHSRKPQRETHHSH